MTILLYPQVVNRESSGQPDRSVPGFPTSRCRQRHDSQQEIRGSAVERPAVPFPVSLKHLLQAVLFTARLNKLRKEDIPGRARLQPCRTDLRPLRASAPEVRGLSMRLRCPRERTVPQRLTPATTVPFTARLKPCPSRIEFSRRLFSPEVRCFSIRLRNSEEKSLTPVSFQVRIHAERPGESIGWDALRWCCSCISSRASERIGFVSDRRGQSELIQFRRSSNW